MSKTETTEKQLPALPEVQVKFTPAVIEVNFDDLKSSLELQIAEQSATVVTVENLQQSKKLAADMNKTAGVIKAARIEYAKKAGENISAFEASMKSLEAIVTEGRAKIDEQVKRFEAETKQKALEALRAYLVEQCNAKGIRPEFQCATVDDLATLTALTSTGNLSGKVKSEIEARINADLQLQQQTDMRLVMLENQSYKAGLAAPLARNHVELFLYEPDNIYQMRLDHLFEAELLREKQAREAADKRAADEAKRNAEAQQRAAEAEARAKQQAEQNALLQQQQAEQNAKHQAEMEALRQQAAAAPAQQPVTQQPTGTKFAYAPLNDPASAKFFIGEFNQAAQTAVSALGKEQVIGIWTKAEGLIAIIHNGIPFFRNL